MKSEAVKIDSISEDPANLRRHGERNLETIKASLKRFGQQKPIVVDSDGIVRAGNGTLLAAKQLGWSEIEIVRSALKGSEATAYAIADNRTAELADWDEDALAQTLAALQTEDEDLALATGFDSSDIDALLEPDEVIEDEVPEPPVIAITKRGDVWLLGAHRVMCGDSTSADDVARLMRGEKAELCFTSPPYALGKSVSLSGNRTMSVKGNAYDEHEDNAEAWDKLMREWFLLSGKAVSDVWVVNVQPLAGNKRDLVKFIAENANRLVDFITWDKGHAQPPMAAGVLSSRFEWMVIFSSKDNASRSVPLSSWRGTIQSVYVAPPQRHNDFAKIHAATMPIHVPSWVMQTLCDRVKSVYDPFLGSGTTLIAAEQLSRKCYGMEISPQYCDVIVARWEKLTGKKARLEEST